MSVQRLLYIVLPVHNRSAITQRFIDCLAKQVYQNYHLVLIDDGCTDDTVTKVQSKVDRLTVIRGVGNWWWGGSLQQGFLWLNSQKRDGSEVVLVINDDTTFSDDFLEEGLEILSRFPRSLVAARFYSLQEKRLIDWGVHVDWKRLRFEQVRSGEEIECLSTRGLFVRLIDFIEIGGFFPRLLPHYASDHEFTIRAHRKGFRLVTHPDLMLWGDETTTGISRFEDMPLGDFFRLFFSKRSVQNPLYWTSFVLLSAPLKWKISAVIIVWLKAMKIIIVQISRRFRKIDDKN
jgi:GT2 family glycosyltransferase